MNTIEAMKEAVEFGWRENPGAAAQDFPRYIKELAIHVEHRTGERFDFQTGGWRAVVSLPWRNVHGTESDGHYVIDANNFVICKGLRKTDAEFIVRRANQNLLGSPIANKTPAGGGD